MRELLDILKTRYDAVLQSDSDRLFYLNIHAYIDIIVKNPEFLTIMDKYETEYTKAHRDIVRPYTEDEEVLDERGRQVIKLERFNLYTSGYCSLLMRIYLPLEDYKNPDPELVGRYDPVVFLMLDGLSRTMTMGLWSKEALKTYNRWYDGQRKEYENNLRQFHANFITEIGLRLLKEKPIITEPAKEIPVIKNQLSFDKEKSVLTINDNEIKITLKNDKTNSHYVLEHIFENEDGLRAKSYYSEIIESKFLNEKIEWRSLYRACNDINAKVSKQASVSNFLLIKSGKSGYTQVNSAYL